MGKCSNCGNILSKKNNGLLCRNCYLNRNKSKNDTTIVNDILANDSNIDRVDDNKQTPNVDVDNDNDFAFNDSNMLTFIKDSMLKEKAWNDEIREMLNDQIKHLKTEMLFKNTLIEQLICELNNRSNSESCISVNNNNNNNNNNK